MRKIFKDKAEPINIDKDTWIYAEGTHATLLHDIRDKDRNYLDTVQIKITKSLIKKILKVNP